MMKLISLNWKFQNIKNERHNNIFNIKYSLYLAARDKGITFSSHAISINNNRDKDIK